MDAHGGSLLLITVSECLALQTRAFIKNEALEFDGEGRAMMMDDYKFFLKNWRTPMYSSLVCPPEVE